jgi:hypothetical protein
MDASGTLGLERPLVAVVLEPASSVAVVAVVAAPVAPTPNTVNRKRLRLRLQCACRFWT